MMVYPNPTTANVSITYNYGSTLYNERSISIYNELGMKMGTTELFGNMGTMNVNTNNWSAGVYFIRMEGDGTLLQMQRLIVE